MSQTQPDTAATSDATVQRTASSRKRWTATDLGLIAVFAALVAASASYPAFRRCPWRSHHLGDPDSDAQRLVLGAGRGFAAVGLYVLLGFAGLPIFSGGRSGLGILATPPPVTSLRSPWPQRQPDTLRGGSSSVGRLSSVRCGSSPRQW